MAKITAKRVGLLFYYIIYMLAYTLTVSLFLNMKRAGIYAMNPEKKKQIKRELESKKLAELLNTRLKRVERLLYGIYEDPEYAKSDRGKSDMKDLQKETR